MLVLDPDRSPRFVRSADDPADRIFSWKQAIRL